MKHLKKHKKHVFCIEGFWDTDRKKKIGIQKALEFLEIGAGIKQAHFHASSEAEFTQHINEFKLKRSMDHSILYLAYHGEVESIILGKRKKINLDQLAELIGNSANGKIIHFGSCLTFATDRKTINGFMKKTGATIVSGYSQVIDFIDSTFLDIMYFKVCQQFKVPSSIDKRLNTNYRSLIKGLGFKMYYEK